MDRAAFKGVKRQASTALAEFVTEASQSSQLRAEAPELRDGPAALVAKGEVVATIIARIDS